MHLITTNYVLRKSKKGDKVKKNGNPRCTISHYSPKEDEGLVYLNFFATKSRKYLV